jgi:hypothetical protein
MGFFTRFSRRRQADSKGRQNCDSARIFALEIRIFLAPAAAGRGGPDSIEWQSAGDLLEVGAQQFGIVGSRRALGHREVFAVG